MGLMKYLRDAMSAYLKTEETDYAAAYRRCFEGTPEEMERRLEAWDWTHRVTRAPTRSSY